MYTKVFSFSVSFPASRRRWPDVGLNVGPAVVNIKPALGQIFAHLKFKWMKITHICLILNKTFANLDV